jgi:hypothetical protein
MVEDPFEGAGDIDASECEANVSALRIAYLMSRN